MATAGATVSLLITDPSFPPAGADRAILPFWAERTVAAIDLDHDDDNMVIAGPFPANSYFPNAAGMLTAHTSASLAAADLDVTFGFGGVDGVLDYALLAVVDFGVGAATTNSMTESLDTAPPWIDVSGLYLVAEVILAADTPAAGTIEVAGFYSQNIRQSGP